MNDYERILGGLLDLARTGADGVRQAAENAAAGARLRLRIGQLEGELEHILTEAGRTVYATHTGSPSDSETLHGLLAEADRIRQELNAARRSLAELRGYAVCPDCGEVWESFHRFCQACGSPLWP